MAISFGGLATGLDTGAIIDQLMAVERLPINRLEADKTWMNNRLKAFTDFDSKLKAFQSNIETLGNREGYYKKEATTNSGDYLLAKATNDAVPNTSYSVEVVDLAKVEKSYTVGGFSSQTDNFFGTGNLVINVGGTDKNVAITALDNDLKGIAEAINEADIGVSAAVINDGDPTNPYRLTLTGNDVGTSFSIDISGITGGTESLGSFAESQPASQAHIRVDGIDIYSDSNSIEAAVPGVTLDLLKAEVGETTQISVTENTSSITENINSFIKGYNEVVSFVTGQSAFGETESGILSGDSGLNSIKRRLQNMLTDFADTNSSLKALSQLGLETQKDGTISLDSETLNQAIESDLDGVVNLLAGEEDGDGGIAKIFEDYLSGLTNSTDGVLAGRRSSITTNVSRIDSRIEQMEARLEQREKLLNKQFLAMEQLVSSFNATSNYLTRQLDSINLGGNN
jgi:flagellar hook-associated protein 2